MPPMSMFKFCGSYFHGSQLIHEILHRAKFSRYTVAIMFSNECDWRLCCHDYHVLYISSPTNTICVDVTIP